jgi:integrase/recombinase XerD
MTIQAFLKNNYTPSTVRIYLFEINHFLAFLGKEKARAARYKDIITYVHHLRKQYDNPATISRIVHAIKQYYFFLIETNKREDHPCRRLQIKRRNAGEIQIQDLLSKKELEMLLQREERYEILTLRNRVVMSLLVHQALRPKEIEQLKSEDLDLEKGEFYTKGTPKTNARTLPLKPEQIMLFYRYVNEVRPQLVKSETEAFIITQKGTPQTAEGIHYLIETFRPMFPTKRLTPTTIRQSVIAAKLKSGNDLRIVQVFAGHKKPSATEKYRQNNLEALKLAINKHHPLK